MGAHGFSQIGTNYQKAPVDSPKTKKPKPLTCNSFGKVGLVGLEPMTSTMSTWRSNQLSYNPILFRRTGVL